MNGARAAHDARRAKEDAERRAREAEQARLRADPAALRAHLQEHTVRFDGHLAQFGPAGAAALGLLLASREPMSELERDVFAAIVRQLDEDLLEAKPAPTPVPPTWAEIQTVEQLVEVYRRQQRARLDEVARRYDEGPLLRGIRRSVGDGELLGASTWAGLEGYAQRDHNARQEQERLRVAYLSRRDHEARGRKHQLGVAARLAHGRSAAYPLVDRDQLRVCPYCEEIAYPPANPERDDYGSRANRPAVRCHFCGTSSLAGWDPGYQRQLDYGAAGRAAADLTFAATDGCMDDHPDNDQEVLGL